MVLVSKSIFLLLTAFLIATAFMEVTATTHDCNLQCDGICQSKHPGHNYRPKCHFSDCRCYDLHDSSVKSVTKVGGSGK